MSVEFYLERSEALMTPPLGYAILSSRELSKKSIWSFQASRRNGRTLVLLRSPKRTRSIFSDGSSRSKRCGRS